MELSSEKRKFERFKHGALLQYGENQSAKLCLAKMCNYNEAGMNFETDTHLNRGSEIYVIMGKYIPDLYKSVPSNGYHAEVIWCRPVADSDPLKYSVGIQYPVPIQ